ncbi:MAG: HEAT repeat domain-containing protein [Balneolaceae bacterium]|nr:HEAT repeat domain-containing protein [Balneolaceae bacterium]MCH8548127.1 HEAT repeat domain-containing protein [Balneolaceae bacterium]
MIEFFTTYAERIILVVLILLILVSLVVFSGAVMSRWLLNRNIKRRERIRIYFGDLVIRYISGDLSFEKLKRQLHTVTDYIILLEVVNRLDLVLEGEEERRLKRLLNLKRIREYFTKQFENGKPLDAARACLYFSRQRKVKESLLPRIAEKTVDTVPAMAYSAGMAIMVHGNAAQKKVVIHNLMKNRGISNQAMSDLIKAFQSHTTDDRVAEGELLMDLIAARSYSPERTALMIRALGELGFYESAGFLLNEFEELDADDHDWLITEALIDVLTAFGMHEIQSKVRECFVASSYNIVRRASARALGVFPEKMNVHHLEWLLADSDFYVRFDAAKSLIDGHGIDPDELNVVALSEREWKELKGEIMESIKETA